MPSNTRVYDRIGALYDAVLEPVTGGFRRRAIASLDLAPEDRLLVVGIGTGLDLPFLPRETRGMGVDLSEGMLRRARDRRERLGMRGFELRKMDAQALDLPDESFDAVYMSLIVAIADDGARVLGEAARVAKPGARLVVVDKFWPEGWSRPSVVRAASDALGNLVTHFDRRFSEIKAGAPDLRVVSDEPLLLGGFVRLIRLEKPG